MQSMWAANERRTRGAGRERKIWMEGSRNKRIRDRKSVTDGCVTVRRSNNPRECPLNGHESVLLTLATRGFPEERCTQTLPVSLPVAALAALGGANPCELRPRGCLCIKGRSRARGHAGEAET